MSKNKKIYDWIKRQSWGNEFERLVISNLGLTLAHYIVSCDGNFEDFIYEGCGNTDECWNERANMLHKFIVRL